MSTATTPTVTPPAPDTPPIPEAGMPLLHGMRLASLASWLIDKPLDRCVLLELGCGAGEFLEGAHRGLGLNLWGTDRVPPQHARDRFLATTGTRTFDAVLMSKPVVGSSTEARTVVAEAFARVGPGGVLVFQTAAGLSADERAAIERLGGELGVARAWSQDGDPTVHAWRRAPAPERYPSEIEIPASELSVTERGRRDGASITETSAEGIGLMVFGPYRDLEAGRYRAEVHGEIEGTYDLRVIGEHATIVFAAGKLSARATTLEFSVRHYCTNFECVIRRVSASRRLRLDKIVLHRLGPA